MSAHWPKLSVDLTCDRHPCICQACGGDRRAGVLKMQRWIECDAHDKPTETLVFLCERCSKKLIGPHPRLYHQIYGDKPIPGAMHHLCGSCDFRRGLSCSHPDLKQNGGKGMNIRTKFLGKAHLYFGGGKGAWIETWEDAKGCAGHSNTDLR